MAFTNPWGADSLRWDVANTDVARLFLMRDREGQLVVSKFRPEAKLDPTWLFKIVQERKDLQLTPPATLRLDMKVAGKATPGRSRSWWTARATAGEVTGGFTKDEILRPAKEDPRAEGGVFSRVSGLLRDLSEGVRIR